MTLCPLCFFPLAFLLLLFAVTGEAGRDFFLTLGRVCWTADSRLVRTMDWPSVKKGLPVWLTPQTSIFPQ
jgi:hypothetical protein